MSGRSEAPERAFVGGLWSAGESAIWPLARLELLSWGVRVGPSAGALRRLVTGWVARYEDISVARRVFVPVMSRGVLLESGAGAIVFWTRRGADILTRLQLHGVPVDWTVGRGPWGAHLEHP